MDVSDLVTVGAGSVTAAVAAQTTTPVTGFNGLTGFSGFARFAGTGGTSFTVWLQTSPDGGTTWVDLYCAHFTVAGVALFSLVQGAGAALAVTDGSLAQNTALNSGVVPLFDQFRLKFTSVGIWASGVFGVYGMPRG